MFFVLALLMSASALALGIAPASKVVDFRTEKEIPVVYRLYNTEQKALTAEITANGSLSKYLRIEPALIVFKKGERYKTFTVYVRQPEDGKQAVASIIARGPKTEVSAELSAAPSKVQLPTGSAVEEPKKAEEQEPKTAQEQEPTGAEKQQPNSGGASQFLLYALLGVVIIGNILYFVVRKGSGKKQKDKGELKEEIIELKHELDTFDFPDSENSK